MQCSVLVFFCRKRKSKASIDEPDSKKPKAQEVDKEKEKMKVKCIFVKRQWTLLVITLNNY